MSLTQISTGKFHSLLEFVRTGGTMVYQQSWHRKVHVRGKMPETHADYVLIGTNTTWKNSNLDWCGQTVGPELFSCCSDGAEIDFTTPEKSHLAVLLAHKNLLANALGFEASESARRSRFIELPMARGERLLREITNTVQKYHEQPGLLNDAFESRLLESRLLETLGRCLAHGDVIPETDTKTSRRAFRWALEYAEAADARITALELAVAVGSSQRALELAFRDSIGITPGAYLRILRLNRAHRDLATAGPDTSSVAEIADHWGFKHHGRFSMMHGKLFGELPVNVLNKSRPLLANFSTVGMIK